MKDSMRPGIRGEATQRVVSEHLVSHYHADGPPVYGSPFMLMLMEHAAFSAMLPHQDEGEQSVGVKFNFEHLAATPPGAKVVARAEATAVEGNMVTFNVEAYDEHEQIGRGTHTRAVIDVARFQRRLAKKRGSE
jgi:predicted thioesterase